MKNLTKFLVLSSLILLSTGQMWAYDISANSTFVWDAGQESWTTAQLYIYKDGYSTADDLTRIGQTTQFYKNYGSKWEGYAGLIVRKDKDWSAQTTDIKRNVSGVTLFTYCNTKDGSKLNWQVTESAKKLTSGKKIYFDNTNSQWDEIHLKYGTQWFNRSLRSSTTKVTGTDNLYVVTMPNDAYCAKWYLADDYGWTNYNDIETYNGIDNRTHTQTSDLSSDITFVPSSGSGSPKVWETSTFSGHTRTVTITTPTNGSIKVTYTNENGTSQTKTSGSFSVAQTCILTVTATGNDGYHLSSLSVGGSTFTSGNTYIVRAATTISATFEETKHTANVAYMCGSESIKDATTSDPAGIVTYAKITAPEIPGYSFSNWSTLPNGATLKTGDALTNATINVNLSKDGLILTANYTVDKTMYTYAFGRVTGMTDAMGSVSSSPNDASLEAGTEITVTATLETGYEVEGWYSDVNGQNKIDGAGTANPYVFQIAGNTTVYVKFQETKYTVNVAKGTGVSSVSPASVSVGQINASENITATLSAGYENVTWNLSSGITPATNYTTSSNPIKVKATADGTITATATPKTYTISFDQNGGTGGQTETVTATYDQAMPGTVTCPTRFGYEFQGYYYNSTKYYNADGTSAHAWDVDQNNITLTAEWTELECYMEGRFHIRATKDGDWVDVAGSGSYWSETSKTIKFTLDESNRYYKLETNLPMSDLSYTLGGDGNYQYFSIKQVLKDANISTAKEYMQNEDCYFTPSMAGIDNAKSWGVKDETYKYRPHFGNEDKSGYVTIYFDETKLWFEIEPATLHNVTITTYGGGSVNPRGTYQIGPFQWDISATPDYGYKFDGWTVTGDIQMDDINNANTKITATGDGTISANFKQLANIYFQTNGDWGNNPVYIYFYKNNYYDDAKGSGSQSKNGCIWGPAKMDYTGANSIHRYPLDIDDLTNLGWNGHVAFTPDNQNESENFFDTKVVYCNSFDFCDNNNMIKATTWQKDLNKNGDKHASYYNYEKVHADGSPSSYYILFESENWKEKDENMFQDARSYTVIKHYETGADDEFRIRQNCGNYWGCNDKPTVAQDEKNWNLYKDLGNLALQPWKSGDYEFKFDVMNHTLNVTYLGDITVANFPGEVSTFVNRQHKVKPDVTLRNGTKVTDVTITVNGNTLPWSSSYATYEQNGTNLIITGKDIGTETVTVRYQNNKQPEPYIVDRTLKVNVANPIVIQAELTEDDTHWTKTGLVHIHFWGTEEGTAQDLSMSYNEDTKLFSVTAPMISNPFNFMFWYGEDINTSASEQWRKTGNIQATTSTCYTISNGTSKTETRTATPKSGLCSKDEYYVEITMKNGNTYKSNTISDLSKKVSFFAPKSNDDTYTGGTVRIVHNGVVSNPLTGFSQAGVYVAKLASATAFAENSIELYTGNYYIRTDGAHGTWSDYKTDDDNIMISFTPRAEKGETFSYYWVKNVAKTGTGTDGKVNVKADVANDYNDNLAGMIENDKFTDGGGYVYESTNGANVRFSYEPTTNEFKRAILGGAGNNNFLNVYSKNGNLYADNGQTKQLDESADLNDSKFSDLSDWVYEKQVYVRADGEHASNVILKSVFNGQTTHLLGYAKNEKGEDTDVPNELEVMGSQSTGDFALRITYDFKKNRLIASWEPGQREISENEIIDSDVLFVQQEAADGTIDNTDVAQITYSQTGINANAKLTSLKNMIYVLEVTNKVIDKTSADNQLYWICLPFDCRISDIYGVEGYVTLNAAGQATDGLWGIQRYDGTTRAQHGWFKEDNPEGFWKWMRRDETMKAGTGYVVVFDKTNAGSWPSIDVEEACEGESNGCKDGKKTVQKRSKRLYFPSIGSKFTISYSGDGENVVQYADEPCNVTSPVNRTQYDGNWKVIGPVSYNNIGVDNTKQDNLTFYYTYNQSADQGHRYSEQQTITGSEKFKSFHSYMTQFGGTLTWKPFTKSEDVTLKAPLYTENSEFQGGLLTIELNDAQGKELNHTFINLSKNGTTGFDQNLDLTKITENCAQIASVSEDVLYAGNTLPLDIETVPLNVKVIANGTYDIALEKSLEGLEVKLYDAFEQTTTLLDQMPATVTLEKGEHKDRFYLQFKQKNAGAPTNLDGNIGQYNLPTDKTQKLLLNGNIYLINAGRVYNATGTMVR